MVMKYHFFLFKFISNFFFEMRYHHVTHDLKLASLLPLPPQLLGLLEFITKSV